MKNRFCLRFCSFVFALIFVSIFSSCFASDLKKTAEELKLRRNFEKNLIGAYCIVDGTNKDFDTDFPNLQIFDNRLTLEIEGNISLSGIFYADEKNIYFYSMESRSLETYEQRWIEVPVISYQKPNEHSFESVEHKEDDIDLILNIQGKVFKFHQVELYRSDFNLFELDGSYSNEVEVKTKNDFRLEVEIQGAAMLVKIFTLDPTYLAYYKIFYENKTLHLEKKSDSESYYKFSFDDEYDSNEDENAFYYEKIPGLVGTFLKGKEDFSFEKNLSYKITKDGIIIYLDGKRTLLRKKGNS